MMFVSVFAQSPHGDELKINCNQCHNPSGWELDVYLMRFDHSKTDFKLEGAHTQTDCKACHEILIFKETPNECASCHSDIHSASVGNDCVRCHTSNTWLVDNIPEIHEENGFPLMGSHSNLSCVDCHFYETNLKFDNIGNDCISCHRDEYLSTESPNHSESGFSTNCLECHNPLGNGWDTDKIGNHDFFPLSQGHDIADCTECHKTVNYADADPNCVSCHQTDYEGTTNPKHNDVGFSTDCATCHSTNPGWTPTNINHDFFPLTQGHDIADCTECHKTANYADADPNCVSCHQTDFDGTTNPNHTAAHFPTDCVACHTTSPNWTPATFDHDGEYFPIYSGPHREGEAWNDCVECHTNSNDYSDFSCFQCHSKPKMDDKHKEENGYEYISIACLQCHPNGRS
jgi:hypothetical protein